MGTFCALRNSLMISISDTMTIFSIVAVIILFGFAADQLFKRRKIPPFFFLILLGIIIGPVLGIFSSQEILPAAGVLGELTLIMVLFYGGMDIKLKTLLSGGSRIILQVALYVGLGVTAITAIAVVFLGWPLYEALIFGSIVGGETTAAVVIPLSRSIGLKEKSVVFLTIEAALNSVVTVILFVTFIGLYQTGSFSISSAVNSIASNFSIAIFMGILLSMAWLYVLNYFKKHRYTYVFTLGLLLATFSATTAAGGSGLLSVLIFGIIIGNHRLITSFIKKHVDIRKLERQLFVFQGEMSFLLETFFFVFLGMEFAVSASSILFGLEFGLLIVATLLAVRALSVRVSTARSDMAGDRKAIILSFPQGLTVATLAILSLQYNLPNADTIVLLATYSIILTNLITTIGEYLIAKNKVIRPVKEAVLR